MRVSITPQLIRAAFEPVKDNPDFEESRGLTELGHLPSEMVQAMCLRPEILAAFGRFGTVALEGKTSHKP